MEPERQAMFTQSSDYGPETVALLRDTLEDAWASLRPEQQATIQKTALAERILKSASDGERDRKCLRDAALMDLAARSNAVGRLTRHLSSGCRCRW